MPNYMQGIQERIKKARQRQRPEITPMGSSNYLPSNILRGANQSMAPPLTRTPVQHPVPEPRPSASIQYPFPAGPYQGPIPRPGSENFPPAPPNPFAGAPYTVGSGPPPGQRPGSTLYPTTQSPGAAPGTPPTPAPTPTPPAPVGAGVSPYGRPLTGPVPQEQWQEILAFNPALTQQIRDAYLSYYGDIPGGQGTLVGLLNKILNEGYPVSRIMQMIREEGYNVPEMLQQAADIVQLEYGPQQSAIERAIAEIQRQLGIDINAQQNYGQIYGASIDKIYDQLNTQLAGLNSAIPGIWNRASEQGQAAYGDALSGLQSGFDQSVQGMQQNASELGIDAALDETIAQLAQSIAPNQQALASEQGSLGQMFAGLSGIYQSSGNRLQGIQAATSAQQQANLINEVMASIGGLQNQATGAVLEQRGLLSDLAANRGTATRDAYRELEQLGYDRARQEGLDRLAETLATHGMSIQDAQLGIQQGQFVLEQGRFALEQAAATGQNALIQAQVDQIYAQIRSLGVNDQIAQSLLGPQIEAILSQNGVNQATITQIMAQAGLLSAQTAGTAAETGYTQASTSNVNAQTAAYIQELLHPTGATDTGASNLNTYLQSINASPDFTTRVNRMIIGAEVHGFGGAPPPSSAPAGTPNTPFADPDAEAYNYCVQGIQQIFAGAQPGEVIYGGTLQQWSDAIRAYFQR